MSETLKNAASNEQRIWSQSYRNTWRIRKVEVLAVPAIMDMDHME